MDKKKKIAGKMKYNPLDSMMEWENGDLDLPGAKKMFQHLVDSGLAWQLQGSYGRTANDMLKQGLIKPPKHGGKGQKDAYGNPLEDYYNRHFPK